MYILNRLATMLRQLAGYHSRNPGQLFMVRIAQGMCHMGKGTLTLNPYHTDKQIFCTTALAGLLVTITALVDSPHSKNILPMYHVYKIN